MSQTRYMNDHYHLFLLNSLAWYNLRDLRWKKIIIISDSTMNPLDDAPYLRKDVAHTWRDNPAESGLAQNDTEEYHAD